MDCAELLGILDRGEDSAHQFKENFTSIDNLAVEISAFANADGGKIIIGVSDIGKLSGLGQEDIHRLNQWTSNATANKIDKSIYVKTEILTCENKRIMIIHVPRGSNRPYDVNRVDVWVKSGADKKRASIEEVLRLAQASGLHFADELEIDSSLADLDKEFFQRRYKKYYQQEFEKLGISFEQLLTNLKILQNNKLTLAGLLLFGKKPERLRPQFVIKATSFAGNDLSSRDFSDKQDIQGKLIEQFKEGRAFIKRNLRRIQTTKNFNAPGVLEIPEEAFAETLANAIIHRNYYISAPIQIYLFDDRLEIQSPGNLPNTITEENIKFGVHVERNPTILSFLEKDREFSYTGRGSGIPRVIRLCHRAKVKVNFVDDKDKQVFSVAFFRKKMKKI